MIFLFTRRITALAAFALFVFASSVSAGNLNPPPGPVASTMKPLNHVEPRTALTAGNTPGDSTNIFIISQAGSYYLTDNLYVGPGMSGIKIAASPVTVDLNGFTIYGSQSSFAGITTNNVIFTNIRV